MGFNATKRAVTQGWSKRHMRFGLHRRSFLKPVGVRATLTTALTGTNNDALITALYHGAAGNSLRFRIVVAGASTPLTVAVSGNDITVNSATSGASAATTTLDGMIAAVNGNADAAKKVFLQRAAGNDGTGVIAALGFTNLTGGVG